MVAFRIKSLAGKVHEMELDEPVTALHLYKAAGAALGQPPDKFKLIIRGKAIEHPSTSTGSNSSSSPHGKGPVCNSSQPIIKLQPGDVLLATPCRTGPSERVQRAAAAAKGEEPPDPDAEEDEALRFRLAPGAPAWEVALADLLQRRLQLPELLLVWLWVVGPLRIVVAAVVLAGAKVASWYDLGPIYLLLALIVTIFTHLGTRQEGEASAYSVFNPGARRLPGQLDADMVDQQIRQGRMM